MLEAQKENADLRMEILLVLLTSDFAAAKSMPKGYFNREKWETVSKNLGELMSLLEKIGINKRRSSDDDANPNRTRYE